MPDISIPQARRIVVDTTGAQIVQEESPAVSHLTTSLFSSLIVLLDPRLEGYLLASLH